MDYAHPASPAVRLSNGDRSDARSALATHQTDGRITESEYSERASAVSNAQTWSDLTPLFADLPPLSDATSAPPLSGASASGAPGSGSAAFASGGPGAADARGGAAVQDNTGYDRGRGRGYDRHGRRPLGGRAGAVIVSVTPLVAVLLFFVTGFALGFNWSWLWFLMVPIAGAIVYAPSWYDDDRR